MKKLFYLFILISLSPALHAQSGRLVLDFDQNWTFNLGDVPNGQNVDFNDVGWRKLNLPHDWSIEENLKRKPRYCGRRRFTRRYRLVRKKLYRSAN